MKRNKVCAILSLDEKDDALKPLTDERPIANLPFGCRYRLIDFPLSSISNASIDTVAIFLAGSGRSVYDHLRNGQIWDLDAFNGGIFTFSQMDLKDQISQKINERQGRYHDYIEFLKKSKSEFVVIMGSKMLCNLDINAVLQHHLQHNSQITVVYQNVPSAMIHPEEDYVLAFSETGKVNSAQLAWDKQILQQKESLNMGIFLLRSADLIEILQDAHERGQTDQLSVILHQAVTQCDTSAYEYTGYLSNINSVKSYYDANRDMLKEKNFYTLFQDSQKIYTKIKNEGPSFYAKESDVKLSQVATGCYIEGYIRHSLIFRNVDIGRHSSVKNSIIMQGSRIGPGVELDYVILDKGVEIGPNVKLQGTLAKPLVIKKNQVILNREDVLIK